MNNAVDSNFSSRRRYLAGANIVAPAISLGTWWAGHPGTAISVIGAAHAAWLGCSLWPNAPWLGPVAGRDGFGRAGANTRPRLWLTIDDGPSRLDHDRLLELLAAADVKASAFVIGSLSAAAPEMVREWEANGHRLENHTWTHASATTWIAGPQRAAREVRRCQEHLGELLSHAPQWFRAPAGLANPWLHAEVERSGLRILAWTARGYDGGLVREPEQVVRRIRRCWHDGAIVLMHQGVKCGRGHPMAPQVLERLLDAADEDGFDWALPDEAASQLRSACAGPIDDPGAGNDLAT